MVTKIKDPDERLAFWALKLQLNDFTIVYLEGATHQNADNLSRLPPMAFLGTEVDQLYELLGHPNL